MAYKINTFDPMAIDHMVTLLKLKIEPVDCKQIIHIFFTSCISQEYFPAAYFNLVFSFCITSFLKSRFMVYLGNTGV